MPEVGERYLGTVVKTTNFGAFVSLLPGKDGLLHISKLRGLAGGKRVEAVEDVVSVGQKIQVQIAEIDDRGKLSLVPVVEDDAAGGRRRDGCGRVRVTLASSSRTTGRQRRAAGRLSVDQKIGATRTLETVRDASGQVTSRIRRTVLPGGLRVITEQMAGVRSASVGVWVGVGSRDETPALHGCSHFLEHLLFKGTGSRSAMDISVALDAVGGEFNAFTAKEYTCFHARVLDDDLPLAVDVLGDMVTDSLIRAEDVEAERDVILDEIAMHDDDPDDVVHNLFAQQAWGDGPLGRPIAGTADSISALTRDQVARFYRRHYRASQMVVAVAGNVDHTAVVRQVRKAFGRNGFLASSEPPARAADQQPGPPGPRRAAARRSGPSSRSTWCSASTGSPATTSAATPSASSTPRSAAARPRGCSRRCASGAGWPTASTASRPTTPTPASWASPSGCLPGRVDDVLETVRDELTRIADDGITEEELERGKGQLRGGLVLGLEDSGSRMSRLGKAELVYDELLSLDEVIARVDAVTRDDVRAVAHVLFTQPEILAVVGPSR